MPLLAEDGRQPEGLQQKRIGFSKVYGVGLKLSMPGFVVLGFTG